MKLYISFSLILFFFFFIGCSSSSVNVIPKKVNINKESVLIKKEKKKVIADNYSIAMEYRRKLLIKGIDYIPWKDHLLMDIRFMPTLLQFDKEDVKRYYLNKSKIVVTKRKTFFLKKSNILFLNYKSNISSIKKFAFKNLKYIKRYKKSRSFKKIKSTNNDNNVQILLKFNNLKGANRLQNELNKLYSSEITRYNLKDYYIIPVIKEGIYKKEKQIYMSVNTTYQEMLDFFQKTRL